jgi:cyclopropane-fatty-acyl-phospholipid synthase
MSENHTAQRRAGASPGAIIAHYDVGNEFFRLWIGPDLIYSCALFEGDDDLERAQLRKLDHHIEAAGAVGASRVLEVGCGWGALMRRMVTHAGVKHVVGLTLSPSQASWVRQIAVPGMEVREEDWRDHKPDKPYDAVISCAAFEAFAHYGISPSEKLKAYQDFFSFCHRMLVDGGRLSIQTIAYTRPLEYIPPFVEKFQTEKIFPESELPLVWEPIAAAQEYFDLLALRNDGDHYYRTLRMWDHNLAARYDEAVAMVGEQVAQDFRQYLRFSAGAFKLGRFSLLRMSFAKRR